MFNFRMVYDKYIFLMLTIGLLFCISLTLNANTSPKEDFDELQKITNELTQGQRFKKYFAEGDILKKDEVSPVQYKSAERWFRRVVKKKWLVNYESSDLYAKRIQLNKVKYKTINGKLTEYYSDEKVSIDLIMCSTQVDDNKLFLIDTQGHNFSINIIFKSPDIVLSDDPVETVRKHLSEITNVPKNIQNKIRGNQIKKHKLKNGVVVYEFRIVNFIDMDNNPETPETTNKFWYSYIGGFVKNGIALIYTSRRTLEKKLYPKGRIKRMKNKTK